MRVVLSEFCNANLAQKIRMMSLLGGETCDDMYNYVNPIPEADIYRQAERWMDRNIVHQNAGLLTHDINEYIYPVSQKK